MNIETSKQAIEFLGRNGYQVRPSSFNGVPNVTYKKGTGNGAWEGTFRGRIGPEPGWVRLENQTCCYIREPNPEATYCDMCGTGINVNVTWELRKESPEEMQLRDQINEVFQK